MIDGQALAKSARLKERRPGSASSAPVLLRLRRFLISFWEAVVQCRAVLHAGEKRTPDAQLLMLRLGNIAASAVSPVRWGFAC
jgi:hypothetical protein